MAQFMILLYGNPADWMNKSPEEMQQAMQKYWAWGDKLQKEGRLLSSHKLTDGDGRVMRGKKEVRVTDGPFTEGKEFLGGYYMFTADSFDHAVEISRNHPQLEYGGTVEVREIHELPRHG
jgi:hypothetical protein